MDEPWQFWLDVGGTFTDCIARTPDGRLLRRKVLSSAVTKGRVAGWPGGPTLVDPDRKEPDSFWQGYRLRTFDQRGTVLVDSTVFQSSSDGKLQLDAATDRAQPSSYELRSPEEAPLLAIRLFLGLRLDEPIPPCSVRLGTTRGTNALLTRRGAKTGFVTTHGFADILRIGYQNRPNLFELDIKKPQPLHSAVAEIEERMATNGSVLLEARDEQIRAELWRLKAAGCESLAICLLNSYANPRHELQVERVARELGFDEVSTSSRISPLMKIVPRGDTTVVDAYLNPVLRTYVERIAQSLALPLGEGRGEDAASSGLRLMTSAGGLVSAANFTGKDSLLSGPAGGVVGCARAAQAAGFEKAIGFDMGGTSTDVTRCDGRFEYTYETEKAGVRIAAPMLAIETVAAGGGSICRFDGVKLVVGPESAGADPGPACYGRGGPLTITDCNLLLGRLLAGHFPFPLDLAAAEFRLTEILNQLRESAFDLRPWTSDFKLPPTPHSALRAPHLSALAAGFLRIANANMAQAIRGISIAKGYDPRDYVLVAFGAAGPQHVCAVADELGITKVLLHPDAGVLSALGIGLADITKHRSRGIYRPLIEVQPDLSTVFDELTTQARADVVAEGIPADRIQFRRALDVRYVGADAGLSIDEPPDGDYVAAFAAAHQRLYGYTHSGRPLEVVAARTEAIGCATVAASGPEAAAPRVVSPTAALPAPMTSSILHRHELKPGQTIPGPALIAEPLTTTVIDPGWQAEALTRGELLLTRTTTSGPHATPHSVSRAPHFAPDPILLELFSNHFTAIATQMGLTLQSTAMSVNVKERRDFSCAIFTPTGDLVVNAPHIPVHLGGMSETVKQIIADNPDMQPGDVFVTNDPYRGGSHLPDVTVITPVFNVVGTLRAPSQEFGTWSVPATLLFFTASRAHHAEIGGITPGSMPPFSKNLAEEGVLIQNFRLLAAGQPRFGELRELLSAGPYPSRSIETNLADIAAQLAANRQGANDLLRMVEQHSAAVVQAYMKYIQDAAERKMRSALAKLPPGRREFIDYLDDGTSIRVAITIFSAEQAPRSPSPPQFSATESSASPPLRIPHSAPRTPPSATIDFTGTGPASAGNLNANRAIVTAAVMYVLRLLVGEDIPLNQGVLAPIEIILPAGILNPELRTLNPSFLPAIVGGNVETSQRIVDVLLGAFGLAAASQGTMNNVLFGDESFGYYETICGGSGATANATGADAVHTHMTNTRLTDPEVFEARYPVRLRKFSIRRGSGGAGASRGGDGVIRRIEFLKPLTLSILSQRRGPHPPYGAAGGQPGALGRNELLRADGQIEPLPALIQTQVHPGDILTIETPGGGGWGSLIGDG